jgi:hypothetical protein
VVALLNAIATPRQAASFRERGISFTHHETADLEHELGA